MEVIKVIMFYFTLWLILSSAITTFTIGMDFVLGEDVNVLNKFTIMSSAVAIGFISGFIIVLIKRQQTNKLKNKLKEKMT